MKHYLRVVYLSIVLVFVQLMIAGCQMNLDGNLICLENLEYNRSDTVDAYGFPILRLKNLYFHSDENNQEYIDIIYNNGIAKTYQVMIKDAGTDYISYRLDNHIILIIGNEIVSFTNNGFSNPEYSETQNSQYYTIASISNLNEAPTQISPSFNEIWTYENHGAVRGNVKAVSQAIYSKEQFFGEDSLVILKRYNMQYDRLGNLIYFSEQLHSKYDDRYSQIISCSYNYDKNGNLVSENWNDGSLNVIYEKDKLNKKRSYNQGKNEISSIEIISDSISIRECNYYKDKLIQKIKYTEDKNNACIYGVVYSGWDGKELRKNKYDKNYSLLDGYIDFGLESEYFNPFRRLYSGSNTERKCNITSNGYNTIVEIEYPYSIEDYQNVILRDQLTFNDHCNLVEQVIVEQDYWEGTKERHYIMVYKYDSKGNWIERQSILRNRVKNDKDSREFIEYREIEYFD